MSHQCPVCGFDKLQEAARSASGGASMEICPACGFQFGVSDDDEGHTYDSWREAWVKMGMTWSTKQKKPAKWDALALLATLTKVKKRAPKRKR